MKLIALAATVAFLSTPALAAAPQCGPADKLFQALIDQYQEKPAFIASGNPNEFDVTVTVSPAGTWTMIGQQGGVACIIGSGDKWKAAPTAAPLELSPGLQKNHLLLIHDWYGGLRNENEQVCCGGSDCGPVEDKDVTPIPGGYRLHITKFDPMASGSGPSINAIVPNARAKPAKEGGQYHLCYWGGEVKCFFFPAPAY